MLTHRKHYLRCAFNIYCLAAILLCNNRRHILSLGGKRQLPRHLYILTDCAIVNPVRPQPQQQRTFGRISQHLRMLFIRQVELCGGIYGNTGLYLPAHLVITQLLFRQPIEICLCYTHLILRQCAGLIGTDNSGRTHCLTGVHLPHQIIGLEHTPHTVSQTQCHSHRQSLRHGNHNQGHSYHYGL